jgi:hypothetical protein
VDEEQKGDFETSDVPDCGQEVEIEGVANELEGEDKVPTTVDKEIQCEIITVKENRWSIKQFETDPQGVHYYTGFDNYDHLMFVFNLLGPAAYDLNYKCTLLEPVDQFFLTMMKLRQAKDDIDLGYMFKVSSSTANVVSCTWINFMYYQFKEIDIWAAQETIQQHFPCDFKRTFPSTRVIMDATETPTVKPSHVQAQSITWSSYKNKNTLKTMIGITPRGAVSYVSDSYGGSASDRQIIERSELLDQGKFEPKDSIMADRGIMVQDLFATKDVKRSEERRVGKECRSRWSPYH